MTDEKALEEHTVAELKEIARDTGKIEGLGAMKKADLINAIRTAQDEIVETVEKVPEEKVSKAPEKSAETVSSLKEKMGILKQKKEALKEKGDRMGVNRLRRRINRLKKRTRILARAVS